MKEIILITAAIVIATNVAFSQGTAINTNGAAADGSAMLDVESTNKGFLLPRMSENERNAIISPAQSLLLYNTTSNCLEIYLGSWTPITCQCSGAPSTPGNISGSSLVCSNATGVVYTVSAVFGASSYTWTLPSGAIITAGQGTNSITVSFGNNPGNVEVSAVNNCGTSAASVLSVSMNYPPSAPGSVTGLSTVSPGQSGVTYSIGSVSGATDYYWTVPSGTTITTGQGDTAITVTFGSTSGDICVKAINNCDTSTATCKAVTVSCYTPGQQTYSYTGSQQTWVVPCGVTSITVDIKGAKGGNGDGPAAGAGANGGRVQTTLGVTAGQTLYIYVGGSGINGSSGGGGGYNGGGNGGGGYAAVGGGGGGSSDIRQGGMALGNRIAVASGGGGGAGVNNPSGGNGGNGGGTTGTAGADGPAYICCSVGGGGGGGTQAGGGTGGATTAGFPGDNGNSGSGGNGGFGSAYGGGGGGSGYYGGGGGGASNNDGGGGGGGGSSYSSGTSTTHTSGYQNGNGEIIINW